MISQRVVCVADHNAVPHDGSPGQFRHVAFLSNTIDRAVFDVTLSCCSIYLALGLDFSLMHMCVVHNNELDHSVHGYAGR